MEAVKNNVLIVRVASLEGLDYTGLRNNILESVRLGVLILGQEDALEVMELPSLGSVDVVLEKNTAEPSALELPPPLEPLPSSEAAEKRMILQRLKDYRAANGLGSLRRVAGKTRSKGRINDNTLRMILTGDAPPLPIEDWRMIGRALDKLEESPGAPKGG